MKPLDTAATPQLQPLSLVERVSNFHLYGCDATEPPYGRACSCGVWAKLRLEIVAALVSETALPVCKICGAQHGKIDDVEYDCPHHPSLPSAIAPITGEITGNRAKREESSMLGPECVLGPDFHDFAARHPEWCSGTMLVKMRAAFDAGRSSVSSSAAKGPAQLVEVLDAIEDYLEQHQDVMDGNDGPRPNEAMSLLSRIAEARTQWARAALSSSADTVRLNVAQGLWDMACHGGNADHSDRKKLLYKAAELLRESVQSAIGEQEPLTTTFVQTVPDKCDRIVWRGRYYHLAKNGVLPSHDASTRDCKRGDGWCRIPNCDCPTVNALDSKGAGT